MGHLAHFTSRLLDQGSSSSIFEQTLVVGRVLYLAMISCFVVIVRCRRQEMRGENQALQDEMARLMEEMRELKRQLAKQ